MATNYVSFKRSLTLAEYNALSAKDANTLYFIKDTSKLYLGSRLIAEGNTITSVEGLTGAVKFTQTSVCLNYYTSDGELQNIKLFDLVNSGGGDFNVNGTEKDIDINGATKTMSIRKYSKDGALNDSNTEDKTATGKYLVTKDYVDDAIVKGMATADALTYKGVIRIDMVDQETHNTPTPAANKGDVYKIASGDPMIQEGKLNGNLDVEVGDMLICNKDNTAKGDSTGWDAIQRNENGVVIGPNSATVNHIATFDSATGKVIKDSGFTIQTSVPSGAVFTDTHDTNIAGTGIEVAGERGQTISISQAFNSHVSSIHATAGEALTKANTVISLLTWDD